MQAAFDSQCYNIQFHFKIRICKQIIHIQMPKHKFMNPNWLIHTPHKNSDHILYMQHW